MPWCPRRLLRQTTRRLRGACQREHALDGHRFSRHHDVAEPALGNSLPFCPRALGQRLASPWAQGRGMVHPVLPMEALWPCVGSGPAFLGPLGQRRREFVPPCVQLRQVEHLGLRGIESAVGLPL